MLSTVFVDLSNVKKAWRGVAVVVAVAVFSRRACNAISKIAMKGGRSNLARLNLFDHLQHLANGNGFVFISERKTAHLRE